MSLVFGRKSKRFVAVDYDSRQMRLVVFEYVRREPVICSMHAAQAPEGVDLTKPEALGEFLRTVVEKLHLQGANALFSVGRSQALLKSLVLPPGTTAQELPSMVQFQAAKDLPFAAEESIIDFTPGAHWDTDPAHRSESVGVLVGAVRMAVVESAREACLQAGLTLVGMGLRPFANQQALYRCVQFQARERVLLVNLTSDEAEIDVISDQELEFSRAARLPANGLEADSDQPAPAPAEERKQAVRRVVTEVVRSLQSYHALQRGSDIAACLVAGATGLEADAVVELQKALEIKTELFDPSAGFALQPDEQAASFCAALGLAGSPLSFDFLNPKRPAPVRNVRKIQLTIAAAAAVLLLGGLVVGVQMAVAGYREELRQLVLQRDGKPKDGTNPEVPGLLTRNKDLKQFEKRYNDIQAWRTAGVDWLDQLASLSNILPPAQELYVNKLSSGGNQLRLDGRVKDFQSLADFQVRAKTLGYDAPLQTQSGANDPYGYNSQFAMTLTVTNKSKPLLVTSQPVGRPSDDTGPKPPARRPDAGSTGVTPVVRPPSGGTPTGGGSPTTPTPGGTSSGKPSGGAPTLPMPGGNSSGKPAGGTATGGGAPGQVNPGGGTPGVTPTGTSGIDRWRRPRGGQP